MMEEKLSYKDVALVTGDMERYREAARRYFEAQAIPLFIDDKADISENSFVEMLRSAMDVILKDFSYESVFRYLRSGYSDIDAEAVDVLDNYILATGIRGKKRWTKTFVKRYRDFKEEDFLRVNESREKVVKELEPLFIMTASASVREYTQALRQFIQEIGEKKKSDILPKLLKRTENLSEAGNTPRYLSLWRNCWKSMFRFLEMKR